MVQSTGDEVWLFFKALARFHANISFVGSYEKEGTSLAGVREGLGKLRILSLSPSL